MNCSCDCEDLELFPSELTLQGPIVCVDVNALPEGAKILAECQCEE